MFKIDSRPSLFVFSPVMRVLFWRADQEKSHDTSMVTSHVDHVVGLSVLHISQVSSLGQNVVNLLLFSFWRDEGRLFLWRFFEHRVERRVIIQHQPAFQPVTSLVAFVEGVLANTFTFRSFSRSQLCIEVSSNDWNVFPIIQHVFLNCFVHLLNVVTRKFRVWEVHTHQFDVLAVYQDRGSDGTFIDALNVNNSFPPPFVQNDSNPVFVVLFSSSHEDVFVMCLP